MDLTTFIGIFAAIALIVFGIVFDFATGVVNFEKIMYFLDLSSIIIVAGGTMAALLGSYTFKELMMFPKHIPILLGKQKWDTGKYIDQIVEFAQVARKGGLLSLQEQINTLEDPFFKNALLLLLDAVDAGKIRSMLENELVALNDRHEANIGFYDKGAALAPALGMLGTIIGLINMLKGLDVSSSDSSKVLGEGMSVALVTTFYGSLLANVVFNPIANKLKLRNSEEIVCKQVIIEGVLAIQAGENPKFIKEKLASVLSQKEKLAILASEGGEDGGGDKGGKKKKEKPAK